MLGRFCCFPNFWGEKPSFLKCIEMLCFVRNSGVGCFIWISLGCWDPINFGTWTICSRLPLDAYVLGTVIFPPSISLLDFCSTCDYESRNSPIGMPIRSWRFTTSTSRYVQTSNHNSWTRSWNRHKKAFQIHPFPTAEDSNSLDIYMRNSQLEPT